MLYIGGIQIQRKGGEWGHNLGGDLSGTWYIGKSILTKWGEKTAKSCEEKGQVAS